MFIGFNLVIIVLIIELFIYSDREEKLLSVRTMQERTEVELPTTTRKETGYSF